MLGAQYEPIYVVKYKLGSGWNITINVWTIYNAKTDVVSFFIESGKKIIICDKFEVNDKGMKKLIIFFFYIYTANVCFEK